MKEFLLLDVPARTFGTQESVYVTALWWLATHPELQVPKPSRLVKYAYVRVFMNGRELKEAR